MPGFGFGKLQQKPTDRNVARTVGRLAIESLSFYLHFLGERAHLAEDERPHQPERRLVRDEILDVVATDQRQIVAKLLAVEVEQHRAVMNFLLRHLVEYLGGGRKLLTQAFGKTAIDAAVFFLVGDGKREHFLLGEVGKAFHRKSLRSAGNPLFNTNIRSILN